MWSGILAGLVILLLASLLLVRYEGFQSDAPAPAPAPVAFEFPGATPAPASAPATFSVGPAPAPVSYAPSPAARSDAATPAISTPPAPPNPTYNQNPFGSNLSVFDRMHENNQNRMLNTLYTEFNEFKPAIEDRVTTTEGNVADVVRNVATLAGDQLVTNAKVKNLQEAMPGWQALTEPGYVSSPGQVRPAGAGSERPTYPAAASIKETNLESYIRELVLSIIAEKK